MEQQTLPEDIREKIKDKVINDDLFSSGASVAYQYAAFSYHLRDSEVEGWKAQKEELLSRLNKFGRENQEQAATIKELLEGLEWYQDRVSGGDIKALGSDGGNIADSLLQKHKP